jgi:PleD family two-component response regulator
MQAPVVFGATELKVTLSIGGALSRDAPSAEALVQRADEALYQAKEAGRAGYRILTDGA